MVVFPHETMVFCTRKPDRIGEMQKTKHGQLVWILCSVKSDKFHYEFLWSPTMFSGGYNEATCLQRIILFVDFYSDHICRS